MTGTRQSGRGKAQDGDTEVEVWGAGKTDPHSARGSARTAQAEVATGDRDIRNLQPHKFMIPFNFKYYNCFQTTYFSDHLFMFKQSQFQIFEVEQRCGSLSVYWITDRIKCILKEEHLYRKMFHQQLNTSMESKLSRDEQNISAVNQNLCKHILCPMSIFWKYTFYCGHIKEPGFSNDWMRMCYPTCVFLFLNIWLFNTC